MRDDVCRGHKHLRPNTNLEVRLDNERLTIPGYYTTIVHEARMQASGTSFDSQHLLSDLLDQPKSRV